MSTIPLDPLGVETPMHTCGRRDRLVDDGGSGNDWSMAGVTGQEHAIGARSDEPAVRGVERIAGWGRDRPLVVVAMGAALIALGNAAWIWTHRYRGGYDPDEAGYIATSLRMERLLSAFDLRGFVVAVGGTGNGVLVPLLSVPFVLVGTRDPRVVMLVQPALLVVVAIAVAGITRRMAGPIAAISAGLLSAVLPMMTTATQSYWYGLGATACLTVAVWALLSSDRCRNRSIWVFGAALAAMVLTRTMSLGFVPGLIVAGAVIAGRDRRALVRLASSVGLAVVIAAPWYVVNAGSIFDYLFSYGYGPRASRFGSGNMFERTGFRLERMSEAVGTTTFLLLSASALCIALMVGPRMLRERGSAHVRNGAAVGACLGLGTAALVSTSNNGVWFELPMVAIAVALLVAVISAGPRWYSAGLWVVVVALSAVGLAGQWWIVPYAPGGLTSHYEFGFAQYDERFEPTRRDEHRAAAADWDQLNREVLAAIRPDASTDEPSGQDDPVFTMSGNMQLFNTNSLELAGELSGWSPDLRVPDTAAEGADLSSFLTPTVTDDGRTVERILIIAQHDRILFTPDADVDEFSDLAAERGWTVTRRIDMPGGGQVRILRHMDDRPS